LNENVSEEYNYWNDIRLIHNALPEIDLDDIDLGVKFFGKRLQAPLIISSMTGGFGMGKEINSNLAKAAAEVGVAMGVGSQRAALEKPDLIPTYAVVKDHGVPLIFANLGAPQLVPQEGKRAYGLADAKKAVDMIHADALIVHLNFLQEVVQPEGDRRAKGCLAAIRRLAATFPVMAKPMLEAAKDSADAVVTELRAVIEELKAAMFLTGSTSIEQLQDRRVIVSAPTASWLEAPEA